MLCAAGLCFGAGLGITLFGISYMFIHDGLVHRRFPVGPIAEVRCFFIRMVIRLCASGRVQVV
jgi:hypothetical protein